MEFRVWTELIQQSQGALHVFLPLLDRGLDAVVHRLTDGEYVPLQVKSKSSAINGFVEIVIPASEMKGNVRPITPSLRVPNIGWPVATST